jgi:hypothetical protein
MQQIMVTKVSEILHTHSYLHASASQFYCRFIPSLVSLTMHYYGTVEAGLVCGNENSGRGTSDILHN